MTLRLMRSSFLLLSLAVAGCNTAADNSPALSATGTVVAQADMPEYCQRAASSQYGAPVGNVTTESAVARGSGFLVEGTADTGQKTYAFNCQFDSSRRFTGVSEQ